MQKLAISVFVALCLAAPTALAAGPKKPQVCLAFKVVEVGDHVYGVCHDGKKPKLFSSWTIVSVTDPETGESSRVAVGYP